MGSGGSSARARVCPALLRLAGWKAELAVALPPEAVVMFYPHTSNRDFVIGLLARFAQGVRRVWAGKDTLFRGPFGRLFRPWGGLPVDRGARTGLVGEPARDLVAIRAFHAGCRGRRPEQPAPLELLPSRSRGARE